MVLLVLILLIIRGTAVVLAATTGTLALVMACLNLMGLLDGRKSHSRESESEARAHLDQGGGLESNGRRGEQSAEKELGKGRGLHLERRLKESADRQRAFECNTRSGGKERKAPGYRTKTMGKGRRMGNTSRASSHRERV